MLSTFLVGILADYTRVEIIKEWVMGHFLCLLQLLAARHAVTIIASGIVHVPIIARLKQGSKSYHSSSLNNFLWWKARANNTTPSARARTRNWPEFTN